MINIKLLKCYHIHNAFCSDLDELIESNKDNIKCWIYGHTHLPSINKIHGIPFLCNPIGYPNENKKIDFTTNIKL